MSTSQVSPEDLLHGVEQLSLPELENFVSRVIALQARRKAPSLPRNEAELLMKINQGLPDEIQKRYDELVAKRKAETLTPAEHKELLKLIKITEKSDAKRVRYLVELAQMRGTSLETLMDELGIRTPEYA
jgi:uncharacterized protein YnzC (UPF0291/DUF896 family)